VIFLRGPRPNLGGPYYTVRYIVLYDGDASRSVNCFDDDVFSE